MTRSRRSWILLASLALTGCGSLSRAHAVHPTSTSPPGELLSVPAVGRIYGRCEPGARRWTIRFNASQIATDKITYRIGSRRPRTVITDPRLQELTWTLIWSPAA